MAASSKENDYAHLVQSGLLQREIKTSINVMNFSAWEIMGYDRAECLALLDKNLQEEWTNIVIQLGENLMAKDGFDTLEQGYMELLSYIGEKQPKAKLTLIGNFWNLPVSEQKKRNAAMKMGIDYVDLSDMWEDKSWQCNMGTIVHGNDDVLHKVEHTGVSGHPGDKGMKEIARRCLLKII